MTETKLSDRLVKSSKKLFHTNLKECSFANFLLTGEAVNANDIINHMWKNMCDLRDSLSLLLENAHKKAENTEERHAIEEVIKELQLMFKKSDLQFKVLFGTKKDVLLTNLMSRNFWLFSQFLVRQATVGSLIDCLTVMLSLCWVKQEVQKLKYHPNYKPNKYYDFWCGYDYACLTNTFGALIDANQSTVSCDERKHLIELFKKTIAYGHICFCGASVLELKCV